MKWTRTPLANRFRYRCGEWRIDGIQKRFGRETFYVVWRGDFRIDTADTLAEAKALVTLEIECEVVATCGSPCDVGQLSGRVMTCPHDNVSLPTTSDPQTVCADCGQVLAE